MPESPRTIILLKGHGAEVADLLRRAAAWRALSDRCSGEKLHLAFLTSEPGAVNEELLAGSRPPGGLPVLNLAEGTGLTGLPGLIRAWRLFVSGSTGPYHVAVALHVPAVVIFHREFPPAEHHHPWVRSVVAPSMAGLPTLDSAVQAMRTVFPGNEGRQA